MDHKFIPSVVARLAAVNRRLTRVGVVVGAMFIALMTLTVIVGVFFRYVLNNSLSFVEDVSLIMMVTTAFLVAAFAYRNGANVAISFVTDRLPIRAVRVIKIVIHVLVLWILYRYLFESFALIDRGWGIKVNSLPMAWAWCYMVIPVCFIAMILAVVELLMRDLHALLGGGGALDLAVDPWLVQGQNDDNDVVEPGAT